MLIILRPLMPHFLDISNISICGRILAFGDEDMLGYLEDWRSSKKYSSGLRLTSGSLNKAAIKGN